MDESSSKLSSDHSPNLSISSSIWGRGPFPIRVIILLSIMPRPDLGLVLPLPLEALQHLIFHPMEVSQNPRRRIRATQSKEISSISQPFSRNRKTGEGDLLIQGDREGSLGANSLREGEPGSDLKKVSKDRIL